MTEIYTRTMPRDEAESRRLWEKFSLLTDNLGYIIHPSLKQSLPPSPMIMDLATGNGAFVRHLAPSYPSATLHGTDISTALFPPSDKLPENVNLSTLDIREPIPLELQGKYDLVHARLAVLALRPSEWTPVIQNVVTLLKPHGVIQWEECDFRGLQVLRGNPDSTFAATEQLSGMFKEANKDHYVELWELLIEAMNAAGLENVNWEFVSSDRLPETRKDMTTNLMSLVTGWALRTASKNTPGFLSLDTVEQLMLQVERDIASGCYLRFDIHMVTGIKPKQ